MGKPSPPTPDTAAAPARRWPDPGPVVVALAAVAVYAGTLANGLVYDDRFQVVENPWIRDFRHVPAILTTGAWEFEGSSSNYYRPVMHLVYLLTHAAVGLRPWGYHAVNVALHALASVLVACLARRLLARAGLTGQAVPLSATLAGLLFAVHPVHTEAVAWVAGVPELVFSACLLGALLLHLRGGAPAGRARDLGVAGLYFVALMAKETAVVLPGLLLAADAPASSDRTPPGTRARRYLAPLVAALAYAAIRLAVLPGVASLRRHPELSTWDVAINAFPLFAKYLAMLVLPAGLNAFHVLHPIGSLLEPRGAISLAATAAFAAVAILAARRRSPALAGLALVALPLLPVLYIPVLGENSFAERYLYLPSAGPSVLVALGLAHLRAARPGWWRPAVALVAMLCAVWSGVTLTRTRVWRDDYTLWTHTVRQSPDSAYANNEAGIAYAERGMLDEAIRHYELAIRLSPASPRMWNNLASALDQRGETLRAVERYRRAIALDPAFARAHSNLGTALARLGALAEAQAHYERALELAPGAVEIRLNLANLHGAAGRPDAAMAQYQAALRLAPESADVHLHLGIAHGERGDLERAIAHLEAAARLAPADPLVRQNLEHARALRASRPR